MHDYEDPNKTGVLERYLALKAASDAVRQRSTMMAPKIDDPQFWHSRAEEVRVIAEQIKDDGRRLLMLRIAEDYELLAGLTKSARSASCK